MHAAATTPTKPLDCVAHYAQRWQPSPNDRRVGLRIIIFGACSAFTRVAACMFAGPPKAARYIGVLRLLRHLYSRSDCYRLERQLPGGSLLPLKSDAFARHTVRS